MYPPGHVGLTAVLFAPLLYRFRRTGRERAAMECLLAVVLLSLLPDVDAVLPGLVHRGVTHTLLAAVLAGLLVALVLRGRRSSGVGLSGEHPVLAYGIGVASIVSHLAGDVITPMGIQPLYPLWGTVYTFDLVRASSPTANTALLVTGAVTLVCIYSVRPLPAPTEDAGAEEAAPSAAPFSRQ